MYLFKSGVRFGGGGEVGESLIFFCKFNLNESYKFECFGNFGLVLV